MGRVIGKQGRIAKAIRVVMRAAAVREGTKVWWRSLKIRFGRQRKNGCRKVLLKGILRQPFFGFHCFRYNADTKNVYIEYSRQSRTYPGNIHARRSFYEKTCLCRRAGRCALFWPRVRRSRALLPPPCHPLPPQPPPCRRLPARPDRQRRLWTFPMKRFSLWRIMPHRTRTLACGFDGSGPVYYTMCRGGCGA